MTEHFDSINDEILRIKRHLAAMHGNDVERIAADARSRQINAVSLSPRPYKPEPRPGPGLCAGMIEYMARDFDAPLEDMKEYME